MNKFPSIGQFRNAIKYWQSRNGVPPTVEYQGTIKLHGTNGAIVYDANDGAFSYQSRSRVLNIEDDNFGFANFWSKYEDDLFTWIQNVIGVSGDEKLTLFGEWCGEGIQAGVGISHLPRMFVIFSAEIDGNRIALDHATGNSFRAATGAGLWTIYEFPTYRLTIDFNNPGLVQNGLITLTEEVEKECPVAKRLGVSGIGEGIVWTPVDYSLPSDTWFKVKGQEHSISKVKKLAEVDVEAVKALSDFVEYAVTENRLKQGLQEFGKPLVIESLGDFIRWVYNDIIKEESDVLEASSIDLKKVGGAVAKVAKAFYFKQLEAQ